MTFSDSLTLSMMPGSPGRTRVLTADFVWETPWSVDIIVKAGYVTDGASIPRLFWRLIGGPLAGRYLPAALVHDVLYDSEIVPRAIADRVFRAAMKELGVSSWRRNLMYAAVRLGGWRAWQRHTPDSTLWARQHVDIRPNAAVLEAHLEPRP